MSQVTAELIAHIQQINARTQAWMDEAEGRWAGLLMEREDFWANRGVYTVEDFQRWEVLSTLSDLHKEAFGFRPRGYDFDAMPNQELFNLADEWSLAAQATWDREAAEQAARDAEFETRIRSLVGMGASDRETAIRWILDGDDSFNLEYDSVGYVCHCLGISYSYEAELKPIVDALRPVEEV